MGLIGNNLREYSFIRLILPEVNISIAPKVIIYTPLQKKRNTWSRRLPDPNLGSATPWGQKVLNRGSFYGSKLRKLPLLTTFCPYGVVDPKLGSWELLNQVLRFFWRGVYLVHCYFLHEGEVLKSTRNVNGGLCKSQYFIRQLPLGPTTTHLMGLLVNIP